MKSKSSLSLQVSLVLSASLNLLGLDSALATTSNAWGTLSHVNEGRDCQTSNVLQLNATRTQAEGTPPYNGNVILATDNVTYWYNPFNCWESTTWTSNGTGRKPAKITGVELNLDPNIPYVYLPVSRDIKLRQLIIQDVDLDYDNNELWLTLPDLTPQPISLTLNNGSLTGVSPPSFVGIAPLTITASGNSQIGPLWTKNTIDAQTSLNVTSGGNLTLFRLGNQHGSTSQDSWYFRSLGNIATIDGGTLKLDQAYVTFGKTAGLPPGPGQYGKMTFQNNAALVITGENGRLESGDFSFINSRLNLGSGNKLTADSQVTLNGATLTAEESSKLNTEALDVSGTNIFNLVKDAAGNYIVTTGAMVMEPASTLTLNGKGSLGINLTLDYAFPATGQIVINDNANLVSDGAHFDIRPSSPITINRTSKDVFGLLEAKNGGSLGLRAGSTDHGHVTNHGGIGVSGGGVLGVLGPVVIQGGSEGEIYIESDGVLIIGGSKYDAAPDSTQSLTTDNQLTLGDFSRLEITLDATAGNIGQIKLGNTLRIERLADLKITLANDMVLPAGTAFTLITYKSLDSAKSHFNGYPNDTTLTLGQNQYKISYGASAITLTVVGGSSSSNGVPTPGTTPLPSPQPVAPKSAPVIGSTVPGDGTVGVFWAPPVDNGGSPITGYKVQLRQGTSGAWSDAPGGCAATNISLTNSPLGCTIPGLTNGTPYYVQVAAINAQGTGDYSAPGLQTPQVAQAPTPTPIPKPTPMTITANPDVYATAFNVSLSAPTNRSSGLLGNDVNCLSVRINTQPSHGTVTLNPNGGFEYKPQSGFVGTDSFTYVGQNGSVESSPAEVSIKVGNANALPPVANPDAFATPQDVALNLPSAGAMNAGVLANDGDPQGYPLTATVKGWPTHGNLTLEPHGGFSYTPVVGYVGRDSFSYSVSNGVSSSEATVLLTVESSSKTNAPPIGNPDAYATLKDVALSVPWPGVLGNDYDPEGVALTATIETQAKNGNVAVGPYGRLNYVPNAGFVGKDSFTYIPSDGVQPGNPVTVTVTVNKPSTSKKPVANPDAWSLPKDSILFVREPKGVLANDLDPSGNQLSAVLVTQPQHGLLSPLEGGGFIYSPETGYTGSDSFTYLVTDGLQSSDPTTVSLKVNATNRPPVAKQLDYPLSEDETLVIPPSKGILSKAVDPDGHLLTTVIVNAPAHGVVVPEADGGMAYIPAPGFSGVDTLRFSVTDGRVESNQASVTFKVKKDSKKVLKAPRATVDSFGIPVGGVLDVPQPGLLRNDRDPQKDPLLVYLNQAPEHGSLHLGIEGEFRYYPDANYQGRDSFTYRVFDGINSSRPARVWLNVKASQKAPKARAHLFSQKPRDLVLSIPAPGLLKFAKDPGHFFLTPYIVEYPSQGLLRLDPNGSFVYYPEPGCSGTSTFKWKASNDVADSNVATSTLKCAPGH